MANSEVLRPDSPEPPPPVEVAFEDGFTLKSVIGALFIALFMLPGGLYLGLVAGQGVGEAAEWVTIVLFAEVARRSFQPLRKQEIYILFYIASSLTSAIAIERGLGGGPFAKLIWDAYFATSPSAAPFASQIPTWAVPTGQSPALLQRELWHADWFMPIVILIALEFCNRISWMGMGYTLFRITSDIEKLPFPYAPVAASGATALAEAGTESWRWSIFSTGTVVGLLFGLVYVGLPVVTGTLFDEPLEIFPIPFKDYTTAIQGLLPAAVVGISFSLGNVLMGFVLPFEIVAGSCAASLLAMVVMNPILYHAGQLPHFKLGSDALNTKLAADMDFWLSIGIGINIAIAIIGFGLVFRAIGDAKRYRQERKITLAPPPGRGDVSLWVSISAWLFSVIFMVVLCMVLVPGFPLWILVFFGFFWSPLNSYISARMIGLTGRGVGFPYIREASIVASGYQKVDVWYAPIPLADHGWAAQRFREVELTGTKFTSILKAEAFMFPVFLVSSFFFWKFFWNANPVPSGQFPYIQRYWPPQATMQAVIMQINDPARANQNWFAEAIKPLYMAYGAVGGLAMYGILAIFKVPLLFFYGFAGGIGLLPANTVPQFLGALMGRKYFAKRYGQENWARYAPVLFAGFACGTGLISMICIALALVAKAVAKLPY